MKLKTHKAKNWFKAVPLLSFSLLMLNTVLRAQDENTPAEKPAPARVKPVKNTFQSVWVIDNQTVMVPVKGTLELDIMHRFGTWNKGYEDFWGFFAPSNIRIGANYVPINNLNVGIGFTKTTATIVPQAGITSISGPLWDGNLKYSIFTQTKGKYPVSLSYYVNAALNTKKDLNKDYYLNSSDRLSYFHQLLIARKVTDKLSVQVAPSLSHHNVVNGYFPNRYKGDSTAYLNDSTLKVKKSMRFDHFAVAFSVRYKITDVTSVMLNYDQPITRHATNNPDPSLSIGVEFNTSSHSFQLFFTNFYYLSPQTNNVFNHNAPFTYQPKYDNAGSLEDVPALDKVKGGRFLIGFNITRLWNY